MSPTFTIHDLLNIGSIVVMAAVTIVALKSDVRWIRRWCDEHKADDDRRFEEVKSDIREMRHAKGANR